MEVADTVADFKRERRHLKSPVGFVPTMGYLHQGHISLVKRAKEENASVVVSVFVNPTQFGPKEDLARYPRDLPRDLEMLQGAGTDVVFTPSASQVYPPGFCTWVDVEGISSRLEGAERPGHFRGVATVVSKLFNIVEADNAYFGQKDAQQLAVIKRMVSDLNMNVTIVPCLTIRDWDKVAMSSRNVYLSEQERRAAPVLYRSLMLAQELRKNGERSAQRIKDEMAALMRKEPLANVAYVSIADPETLEELDTVKGKALVSLAVRFGGTRLIDNITLE